MKYINRLSKGTISLAICSAITMFAVVGIANAAPNRQIPPITDDCVYRTILDNEFQTEIYDDSGTITYRESNLVTDTVTVLGTATTGQIEQYDRQCTPVDIATNDLQAQISGSNVGDWVTNRTAELSQCETDMSDLVALLAPVGGDFDALGTSARDTVISGMADCIETNSRVNRITINKLYQLLIQQGIISE